jgi:hypothetical protein
MGLLRAWVLASRRELPSSYLRKECCGTAQPHALREVTLQKRKRKREHENVKTELWRPQQTPEKTAAVQSDVEESVVYCLFGDSPVTMGKSLRWLQSSHEPSYIFAS